MFFLMKSHEFELGSHEVKLKKYLAGALEATFRAQLKIGQNVFLDEISDELEFWSHGVKN